MHKGNCYVEVAGQKYSLLSMILTRFFLTPSRYKCTGGMLIKYFDRFQHLLKRWWVIFFRNSYFNFYHESPIPWSSYSIMSAKLCFFLCISYSARKSCLVLQLIDLLIRDRCDHNLLWVDFVAEIGKDADSRLE